MSIRLCLPKRVNVIDIAKAPAELPPNSINIICSFRPDSRLKSTKPLEEAILSYYEQMMLPRDVIIIAPRMSGKTLIYNELTRDIESIDYMDIQKYLNMSQSILTANSNAVLLYDRVKCSMFSTVRELIQVFTIYEWVKHVLGLIWSGKERRPKDVDSDTEHIYRSMDISRLMLSHIGVDMKFELYMVNSTRDLVLRINDRCEMELREVSKSIHTRMSQNLQAIYDNSFKIIKED